MKNYKFLKTLPENAITFTKASLILYADKIHFNEGNFLEMDRCYQTVALLDWKEAYSKQDTIGKKLAIKRFLTSVKFAVYEKRGYPD